MKRQIHAYRGHDEIAVEGHNIKLGRGGIREIEFFVQTQQLIAGGRHPELRGRETLRDARRARRGRLDRRRGARRSRRRLSLPARGRAPAADGGRRADPHLAGRSRRRSSALRALPAFRIATPSPTRCSSICATCSAIMRRCSRMRPASRPAAGRCCFPPEADDRETLDRLAAMGFRQPLEVSALGAALARRRPIASLRSEFARSQLAELVPVLLDQFAALGESRRAPSSPSTGSSPACTAAAGCSRCCGRIPIWSRWSRSCSAPRRGWPTSSRSIREVMDAVLDPSFFGALPDEAELAAELDRSLRQAGILRGFPRSPAHVRAGAHVPDRRAHPVGHGVGRAGGRGLRAARRRADPRAAPRGRGAISPSSTAASRGQETAMLALGKLGGREMTATSDLDLIVVYDFDREHPESDGARPLYGAPVFRAADPAADQRADGADQLRRALSGRHAAAPVRPLRPGRDPDRRLCRAIRRTRPGPGSTWR